jgi:hypothetical protein
MALARFRFAEVDSLALCSRLSAPSTDCGFVVAVGMRGAVK